MKQFSSTSPPLTVKQLMDSFDWGNTLLGERQFWPQNLEVLLSLILNTSLPMVIYWGKKNIALYNDGYAQIIGSKHPALLGRPLIDIWPERKSHFNQIVSALYQKETIKYTTNYQSPGTDYQHNLHTQIEVAFSPILDEHNIVQGMLSMVTQTHEPTNNTSEQTIEQLIGGLAHDFNTLLAGIIGNLELMQMRIGQNKIDKIGSYIEAAQMAAKNATDITHQLLSFSRRQTLIPHVIDANHTIQALKDSFKNFLMREGIKEHINIHYHLEPDVWPIFCDPEQLKNAIIHIFENACESIRTLSGEITVQTQNITISTTHALRPFLRPNDYIVISIQDNGEGMSPEMICRATDPFFTTKPLGKRAGLGLSMAYGFTKQSSGHLTINSDPRTGTKVCLYLPRYYRPLTIQKLDTNHHKQKRLQTLLVSQDNRLCMLFSENLEDLGYSMTIAQSKKETFALLNSANSFSFIAIDTRFLHTVKAAFCETIKSQHPDLTIMFITGYEESPVELKQFINHQAFVIRQPITHNLLVESIQLIENSKSNGLV